jgi:predicted  nucleic acid-binding Zn-ribbon protein
MNAILQTVLKLQSIEFGPRTGSANETETAALRAVIPQAILDHYERFRARGKKGVALVVNQVCSGCHMGVTIAKLTTVMRGTEAQRCENCGRLICLPAAAEAPVVDILPEVKLPKKPRKRKAVLVPA